MIVIARQKRPIHKYLWAIELVEHQYVQKLKFNNKTRLEEEKY